MGQGQFGVDGDVLVLPNHRVDRLADHPGNRDIVLSGHGAELRVVPFVQAGGQASFFAVSSRATHRMMYIAPHYCSPAGSGEPAVLILT
jgi:hypothetical protein